VTVDVAKRHACHAKWRWVSPSATPATQSGAASRATNGDQARHQTQPSVTSTTSATQNEGGCRQVPLLPCETTVDVTKCHACHAKWRGGAAARRHGRPTGTKRVTRPSQVSYVPRLPRKMKVDVAKRHPCHAKRPWMSPSATPATQSGTASRATNVDRLPRKTTVDVAKCHACHAKWSGVTGNQRGPSASQDQPSVTSTTLATQNKGGCRQVPRLPRKVARRRHGRPAGTKRITRPSQV